jgi:hypothetical protein
MVDFLSVITVGLLLIATLVSFVGPIFYVLHRKWIHYLEDRFGVYFG